MLLLVMLTLSRQAAGAMSATTRLDAVGALESPVFVDTRSADTCAQGSVEGALCMEPSLFLHPDGTPASFRDINWLAGTFALEPASTVVVFGSGETDNAFVAGMLFLLGQTRVAQNHHLVTQGDDVFKFVGYQQDDDTIPVRQLLQGRKKGLLLFG